jgi:hypothetical protein
MRYLLSIAVLFLLCAPVQRAHGSEPSPCQQSVADWLSRWHPVGGWNPDGGGLVHWWNPHCFPCADGPDDYCRKKLPCVCWPAYPPYFQWGTPESSPCCHQAAPCLRPPSPAP